MSGPLHADERGPVAGAENVPSTPVLPPDPERQAEGNGARRRTGSPQLTSRRPGARLARLSVARSGCRVRFPSAPITSLLG
jgi:hypothetical protein